MVADIAKLSVGREEYYTRELATDHQQYLSGHGESPGRWYGQGSAALGMEGEASVAGFRRMFEGRHPHTSEFLGRPHGRNAVPAFDVVLRPTKSVSILHGLGDAATGQAVLAAHHAGIAEAVAYLGVEWTAADRHGNRELQGMPEELLRAFSKRSDQVDLEVERLEASGRERTPRLVKWASRRPASPSSTSGLRRCTSGGGRRRPSATWTRTPSSVS